MFPHHGKPPSATASAAQSDVFVTTRWSLILDAWKGTESSQLRNLETLAAAYWNPLFLYAQRVATSGLEPQDLVQSFFEKLLARESLGDAQPNRGRFRAFLLSSFRNHVVDQIRHASREKRGGRAHFVEVDVATISSPETDSDYDRAWADALVGITHRRLVKHYRERDTQELFEAIKPFLTTSAEEGDYQKIAEALEMTTPAVTMAVKRLRERFGFYLKQEVERTVSHPDEIEPELRYLLSMHLSENGRQAC